MTLSEFEREFPRTADELIRVAGGERRAIIGVYPTLEPNCLWTARLDTSVAHCTSPDIVLVCVTPDHHCIKGKSEGPQWIPERIIWNQVWEQEWRQRPKSQWPLAFILS